MRRRPNVDADAPLPEGGIITGIVASHRAPGRFTVMIDGKPRHTLGLAAIEQLGLAVGKSTVGREDVLAREEASLRTYDRAVTMLAARGRASRDLERLLVAKGEPVELARNAIERLTREGIVDDAAFARSFVRSKSAGAGLAKRRLEQELGRRGVDRGVVTEAIDEVFSEEQVDEAAAAEALARKRQRSLTNLDPLARRRRLYAFLARRGYSPDVIGSALARLRQADPSDFDADLHAES